MQSQCCQKKPKNKCWSICEASVWVCNGCRQGRGGRTIAEWIELH